MQIAEMPKAGLSPKKVAARSAERERDRLLRIFFDELEDARKFKFRVSICYDEPLDVYRIAYLRGNNRIGEYQYTNSIESQFHPIERWMNKNNKEAGSQV